MRSFSLVFSFVTLVATLILAPASSTLALHNEATPEASPGSMTGQGSPAMQGTGAAYMVIRNAGAEDDRLTGGTTMVAEAVEVHEVVDEEGLMKMSPRPEGLVIPAGGEATMAPGGYHLMLIGLTEDLTNGMTFEITLSFEQAGEVTVPVTVRPRAELAEGESVAEPLVAGDITIEDAWSRPAPALGGAAMDMPMGTPEATPRSS